MVGIGPKSKEGSCGGAGSREHGIDAICLSSSGYSDFTAKWVEEMGATGDGSRGEDDFSRICPCSWWSPFCAPFDVLLTSAAAVASVGSLHGSSAAAGISNRRHLLRLLGSWSPASVQPLARPERPASSAPTTPYVRCQPHGQAAVWNITLP